jgi:hypothetical protein
LFGLQKKMKGKNIKGMKVSKNLVKWFFIVLYEWKKNERKACIFSK